MRPSSATAENIPRFEEDLERLEQGLRALKASYNRYFIGALDRPPVELQSTLAGIIRRQTAAGAVASRRTSDHFRFNTIVSNFQVLTEMWNRNVKGVEEGRGPAAKARARATGTGLTSAPRTERELTRATVHAGKSTPDDATWKNLYSSYLTAVQETGREVPSLPYRVFYERMRDRTLRYAQRTGHADLTCRVVIVDNRPILKLGSGS
ncbi:MAG: hypothetical protein ACE5IK_05690 [Acidobacteriota bacterium]